MLKFQYGIIRIDFYGYDINTTFCFGIQAGRSIESAERKKFFPLPGINFPFKGNIHMGVLSFYLYKNNSMILQGNDIDLAHKTSVISLQNSIIFPFKVLAGIILSQLAEFLWIKMPGGYPLPEKQIFQSA
jgi:hypothetical protein